MVERISYLKPWLILTAGGLVVLAGMFAVALLSHWGYSQFPDGFAWVSVFHLAGTGAAYWLLSRPFIQAYMLATYFREN